MPRYGDLSGVCWRTNDVWLRPANFSLHRNIEKTQHSEHARCSKIWRRDPHLCKLSNCYLSFHFLPERGGFPFSEWDRAPPDLGGHLHFTLTGVVCGVRVVDMVINRRLDFASLGLSSTKATCIHRMVNVINTNLYYSPYLFTLIRTPKQHFLTQGWLKTQEFLMTTWNTNGNWLTDYYFLDIIFRLKSLTKI